MSGGWILYYVGIAYLLAWAVIARRNQSPAERAKRRAKYWWK